MPERLDEFEFRKGPAGKGGRWDEYLDGGIYSFAADELPSTALNFNVQIRTRARRFGKKVHVATRPGGGIVIQAYQPEDDA